LVQPSQAYLRLSTGELHLFFPRALLREIQYSCSAVWMIAFRHEEDVEFIEMLRLIAAPPDGGWWNVQPKTTPPGSRCIKLAKTANLLDVIIFTKSNRHSPSA
jgi:hypothetical protein